MLGKILLTAINAIAPIVLMILLGFCLRKKGFISKEFVKNGSKLVFHMCLPAMLFVNAFEISGMDSISIELLLFCLIVIFVIAGVGLGISVASTKDPRRRGVIWQCGFRSNFAIIGLPLAAALGGNEAIAVAAVVVTIAIPTFNILSVISMSVFVPQSDANKLSIRGTVKGIITNPMTLSVLAGLLCVVIRWLQTLWFGRVVFAISDQLSFLYKTVDSVATLCSPFALIILGAQCEFSAVKGMFREITAGVLARLIIAPLLGIGGAMLLTKLGVLSCGPNEYPALVAVFGSPAAVSGAIMATEMKNDGQLATQLVMWTSIISVATIFLIVCFLMNLGLLQV